MSKHAPLSLIIKICHDTETCFRQHHCDLLKYSPATARSAASSHPGCLKCGYINICFLLCRRYGSAVTQYSLNINIVTFFFPVTILSHSCCESLRSTLLETTGALVFCPTETGPQVKGEQVPVCSVHGRHFIPTSCRLTGLLEAGCRECSARIALAEAYYYRRCTDQVTSEGAELNRTALVSNPDPHNGSGDDE